MRRAALAAVVGLVLGVGGTFALTAQGQQVPVGVPVRPQPTPGLVRVCIVTPRPTDDVYRSKLNDPCQVPELGGPLQHPALVPAE